MAQTGGPDGGGGGNTGIGVGKGVGGGAGIGGGASGIGKNAAKKKRQQEKAAARAADAAAKAEAARRKRLQQAKGKTPPKVEAPPPAKPKPPPKVLTNGPSLPKRTSEVYDWLGGITKAQLDRMTQRDFFSLIKELRREYAGDTTALNKINTAYTMRKINGAADYVAAANQIRVDQARRGSSSYNADQLKIIDDSFAQYVGKFGRELGELLADRNRLLPLAAAGDERAIAALKKLEKSKRWLDLMARADELYGSEPGEAGAFDRYYDERNKIHQANQNYWITALGRQALGDPTITLQDLQRRYPNRTLEEIGEDLDAKYQQQLVQRQQLWVLQQKVTAQINRGEAAIKQRVGDAPAWFDIGLQSVAAQIGVKPDQVDLSKSAWQNSVIESALYQFDQEFQRKYGPLSPGGWFSVSQDPVLAQRNADHQRLKEDLRRRLWLYFSGREQPPSLLEQIAGTIIETPGVSAGLEALGVPFGAIFAIPKHLMGDRGEFTGPQWHPEAIFGPNPKNYPFFEPTPGGSAVDLFSKVFDAARSGGNKDAIADLVKFVGDNKGQFQVPFTGAGFDISPEAQKRAREGIELRDQQVAAATGADAIPDFWKKLTAWTNWGQTPFSEVHGNFGNLTLGIFADPLNKLGLSVYFRGLQLAKLRRGAEGVGAVGRDYLNILKDYRFGVSKPARDVVQEMLDLRPLKNILGRTVFESAQLGDRDYDAILNDIFDRNAVDPNLKGIKADLERAFRGTPVQSKQVQVAAEEMFDQALRGKVSAVLRSGELEKLRRAARDSAKQADESKKVRAVDKVYDSKTRTQRRLASEARERRLRAENKAKSAFETVDDFEDAPRVAPTGQVRSLKRPGDFRAPRAQRATHDSFTRLYGRAREIVHRRVDPATGREIETRTRVRLDQAEGYRIAAHAEPRHAEDIIAIADGIARKYHIGLTWARNSAALRAGKPVVELFGGNQTDMVKAARELDDMLRQHRLGRTPPAGLRRQGKVTYRESVNDARLDAELARGRYDGFDAFRGLADDERMARAATEITENLGERIAALQNDLDAALLKARDTRQAGEAGRIAKRLDDLQAKFERFEAVRTDYQKRVDDYTGPERPNNSPAELARRDFLESELRRDALYLRVERNRLLRLIRNAPNLAAKRRFERRLAVIDEAIAGVEVAKLDQLGNAHVARVVVDRHAVEAVEYVKPQRIAPFSGEHPEGFRVVQAQDMHQQLVNSAINDVIDDPAAYTAAHAGVRDVTFAARRIDWTIAPTYGIDPARIRRIDKLSVYAKIDALRFLSRTQLEYRPFFNSKMDELRAALPDEIRTRMPKDNEQFADAILEAQRRSVVTFDTYRGLDGLVSEAVRKVRGYKAAGQFVGPAPAWLRDKWDEVFDDAADDLAAPNIITDTDIEIGLAKIEALSGHAGMDMRAYDELRGVYRGHLVREMRGEAIAAEAKARAAIDGRPYRDHFMEVRNEAAAFEAKLQLRRFVQRSSPGMRPEDYWRDFVAAQADEQLLAPKQKTLSAFQARSLTRTVEQRLGVADIRRTDQVQAALRGLELPPDFAHLNLMPVGYIPGVPGHIPVWRSDVPLFDELGRETLGYFREHMGLVVGPDRSGSFDELLVTGWHEYAHAQVRWAEANNSPVFGDLMDLVGKHAGTLDRVLNRSSVAGGNGTLLAHELAAEAYAVWAHTQHLIKAGASRADLGKSYTWEWLTKHVPSTALRDLNDLARVFERLQPPPAEYFGKNLDVAPTFTNRSEWRQWLVDNGFWSPAVAEDILAGRRVWSVADEANFAKSRWGAVPPWADADVYEARGLLHDKFAYEKAMMEWGFMDRGLEQQAAMGKVADAQSAVAYGDEPLGVRAGRSATDLRDWFKQRYGRMVTDADDDLTAVPWLMDPLSDEYARYVADRGIAGLGVDRTLMTLEQRAAFEAAVRKAVEKRIKRLEAAGELGDDVLFLPQEHLRWALDITDELMDSKAWRPYFRWDGKPHFERKPFLGTGLQTIGVVQRLNVSTQIAFAVMNTAENLPIIGPKRWILRIANRDLPWSQSVRDEIAEMTPDLASFGLGPQTGLWNLTGRSQWQRLKDADGLFAKARHLMGAAYEAPYQISGAAENGVKLDFARRMFQDRYDYYRGLGRSDLQAQVLARHATAQKVRHFFPTLEGAPTWLHALNEIVPYLSYNWNTTTLYAGHMLAHPQFLRYFDMLGDVLEEANRQAWEDEHPGMPYPNDAQARQLHFEIDGKVYTIDLTGLSDVTRGWSVIPMLANGKSMPLADIIKRFVRVPHPWQAAVLAYVAGDKEPWSNDPATLGSFIWPIDVWELIGKLNEDGTLSQGDLFQIFTKIGMFTEAKYLNPAQSLNTLYWSLPEGEARKKFLDSLTKADGTNDLIDYWKASSPEPWEIVRDGVPKPNWFAQQSEATIKSLRDAQAGYRELRDNYDRRLDDLLREGVLPNDPRYKDLLQLRRTALRQYRLDHPVLIDYEVFYMDPSDWAETMQEWAVDKQIDQFFDMDAMKPQREDFRSDAAFDEAIDQFYDAKNAWLDAHPAVAKIFRTSDDAVQQAIKDHQDHIFELREQIAERDKQIALAVERGQDDLADALRFANELDYMQIDMPTKIDYNPPLIDRNVEVGEYTGYVRSVMELPRAAVLPGATDAKFANATEGERHKMLVDDWYARSLKEVWRDVGDAGNPAAAFQRELKERPSLLAEYFRRNPAKQGEWALNDRYFAAINKAVKNDDWDGFFRTLANDRQLALRWFLGPDRIKGKVLDSTLRRLDAALAKVRKGGNSDVLFRLLEKDPALRKIYFEGGKDREKKWQEGSRYQNTMADIMARVKRTGDWSIFWNAIDNNKWLRERWFDGKPGRRAEYQRDRWYLSTMDKLMGRVKKTGNWNIFWNAIDTNERLRERWFQGEKGRRERYYDNKRYISFIGNLVQRAKKANDWSIFWEGLEAHPDMMKIYRRSHPGGGEGAQNSVYGKAMGRWVKLLEAKRYDDARRYFDSLPAWMQQRYNKAHPQGARTAAYVGAMKKWVSFFEKNDPAAAMKYFDALPKWMKERYFEKHPGKRAEFERNGAYTDAMSQWVKLLDARDYDGARAFFDNLPTWMREQYWSRHPERRDFAANHAMFAKLQEMYLLQVEDQADYLDANPDLRRWIAKISGNSREETRRAMILQVYRAIPSDEPWLRRVFQQRYPEVFSDEAKSERQNARTEAALRERPELRAGYEKYVRLIAEGYLGSLQGSATVPKPLTKVQRSVWEKTRRRRQREYRPQWDIQRPRPAPPGYNNIMEILNQIGG